MPRHTALSAFVAAVLLAAAPARAEPPAALVEEAEEAFALCAARGGEARILDGYRTEADLNGDGVADFVTDLGRMDCAGAWDTFCGAGGCPVAVWLSEPDGRFSRFNLGNLLGFEILLGSGGELPVLRASHHGSDCGTDGVAPAPCTRSWTFATNAPAMPPFDPPPEPAAPQPRPEATAPGASILPEGAAAPAERIAPGWTLRRVPGGSPLALGGGTGRIASLAAFCLQGVPFLAVSFAEPPDAEQIVMRFAFSEGDVAAEAAFEETAGGAYILVLDEGALAARLAGRDSTVALRAGGVDEGSLSLDGSTNAIRAALAECHAF